MGLGGWGRLPARWTIPPITNLCFQIIVNSSSLYFILALYRIMPNLFLELLLDNFRKILEIFSNWSLMHIRYVYNILLLLHVCYSQILNCDSVKTNPIVYNKHISCAQMPSITETFRRSWKKEHARLNVWAYTSHCFAVILENNALRMLFSALAMWWCRCEVVLMFLKEGI